MEIFANEKYNALAYYTLELQDENFIHQNMVDAYTAQFANQDTKAISLAFSLVGLYLYIELDYTGKEVQKFHTLMSNDKTKWPSIQLPISRGDISIDMVLNTTIGKERNVMIKIWCCSVWNSFKDCHSVIKTIADYYLNTNNNI
jgi:Family of unknown function (DUF5946)